MSGEVLLSSFFGFLLLLSILVFCVYLVKLTITYQAKVKSFQTELTQANQIIQSLRQQRECEQRTFSQLFTEITKNVTWLAPYIANTQTHTDEMNVLLLRINQLLESTKQWNESSRQMLSSPFLLQPWLKNQLSFEKAKSQQPLPIHISEIPDLLVQTHLELLEKVFNKFCQDVRQSTGLAGYVLEIESQQGLRLTLTGNVEATREECADASYLLLKKRVEEHGGILCCLHSAQSIAKYTLNLPATVYELPLFTPDFRYLKHHIADETKAKILIVESEPEFMDWLYYHLAADFRLTLCQTWQGAQYELDEQGAELILCDTQLSDGDAASWLSTLKHQPEYAAIPFVMLTAVDDPQQRLQAWQCYADDYVSKNSDPALLVVRLNALIENRRLVQQQMLSLSLATNSVQEPSSAPVLSTTESLDEQFAKRLRWVIDQHITTQELTVEFVAQQFHTSSRSLQRRVQSVFGLSYSQYLKQTQLQIAKDALVAGHSVKEAAYYAGFTSQNYFGRVFRAEYGLTPSQFKKDASTKPPNLA